jgi:maleate isomerase
MGAEACDEAFKIYNAKRIGVVTPYWPVGDKNVARFFEESGYQVKRMVGLKCESPVLIAHVQPQQLRDAFREVDGDDVDLLVQVGTNLACAKVAAEAEGWLKKPVIAINTAIYWNALRSHGIRDQMPGWGSLLERY